MIEVNVLSEGPKIGFVHLSSPCRNKSGLVETFIQDTMSRAMSQCQVHNVEVSQVQMRNGGCRDISYLSNTLNG